MKLRAGETEFFTVADTATDTARATEAQFQLDLVKIYKKATKEKADRRRGRRGAVAGQGLVLLAEGQEQGVPLRRRNRYVFDADDRHAAPGRQGRQDPALLPVTNSRREPMKCARRALGPAAARPSQR